MATALLRSVRRVAANPSLSSSVIFCRQAGGGHWNPDWRADPKVPETEEERIRAAKKYNLLPEDYKPYPEDSLDARGDYPNLPIISGSQRDPYEPFDYPELRRNYGEPLHIDFDMYTAERVDQKRLRKSMLYSWSMFLGVMTVGFLALYSVQIFQPISPHCPSSIPTMTCGWRKAATQQRCPYGRITPSSWKAAKLPPNTTIHTEDTLKTLQLRSPQICSLYPGVLLHA